MAVLVTRPSPDSDRTAEALRARGFDALLAPMLRFEPVACSGLDAEYGAVMATSVNALRAVEAQLLELLQRADDVPAALAVQNQLSQVQLDLEQARGRLQYLENRVAFATISLSMHELVAVPPRGDGFSIVDAWASAGSAFLTVVGWIFVGIAVAAPVLVLLGLGLLAGRELRKRFAHA